MDPTPKTSPKKISPSPFPEISARFSPSPGGQGELRVKMLLDGKPLENPIVTDGIILYRPEFREENLLSVGTHTVQIIVEDGKGEKASREWNFSVGLWDHPSESLPTGVNLIFPKTPKAFNKNAFTFLYSGGGTVTGQTWTIPIPDNPDFISNSPQIPWILDFLTPMVVKTQRIGSLFRKGMLFKPSIPGY